MRRALAFLTPFGGAVAPSAGALVWFPVVGAGVGLAVGGVWWLADKVWAAPAAAAVALVADVAFTGYLHLDGLADSADGLLPPMERSRRLEAMADPAVGAFGVVTVAAVLLLRFGALASMRAAPLVLGALWCGSRTSMAVTARTVPYVRPGGLAQAFVNRPALSGGKAWATAVVGTVLSIGMAVAGRGAHGLAAVGAELVATAAVVVLARRRIGGFTGDVLGAAGVVGETVGLLVLAAKW